MTAPAARKPRARRTAQPQPEAPEDAPGAAAEPEPQPQPQPPAEGFLEAWRRGLGEAWGRLFGPLDTSEPQFFTPAQDAGYHAYRQQLREDQQARLRATAIERQQDPARIAAWGREARERTLQLRAEAWAVAMLTTAGPEAGEALEPLPEVAP